MINTDGAPTIAHANAVRRCSPPESAPILDLVCDDRLTASIAATAAAVHSLLLRPRIHAAYSTASDTRERRGKWGLCGIHPSERRTLFTSARLPYGFPPRIRISPCAGASIPHIDRMRLVFPAPFSPTNAVTPIGNVSVTLSSTRLFA